MYNANIQMWIAGNDFGSSASPGSDVKEVRGQGLRAPSSEGLLVSSLCPTSFRLRCKERKKEILCHKKFRKINLHNCICFQFIFIM